MNFEVGDRVVYNPNLPDLAPNTNRPHNVGTVVGVDDNYVRLKFNSHNENEEGLRILKYAVKHFSQSPKGMRNAHKKTFANTLRNIPTAREGMEARRVWNNKVGLPYKSGPGLDYAAQWPLTVNPNRTTSRSKNLTRKNKRKSNKSRKSKKSMRRN